MSQALLFAPPVPDRPTLHLRSWGWVNARRKRGDLSEVRALTIMADPRPLFGELGDGRCWALTPQGRERDMMRRLVELRRRNKRDPELLSEYRAALNARWATTPLWPGILFAYVDGRTVPVRSGDHLCCACSAADALAGECHRAFAAPWLVRAGWDVFLDGIRVVVEATPETGGFHG